jgi:hypothetical protein
VARWIMIRVRLLGFARGRLRRRSDRAEIGVLAVAVIMVLAAVPVGTEVRDWAMAGTPLDGSAPAQVAELQDQASLAGLIAVLIWLSLTTSVFQTANRMLARRRFATWGTEWDRVGRRR